MTAATDHHTFNLSFTLNGIAVLAEVPTSRVLCDLLRHGFGLAGTRVACGRTVCGACTVLIDGGPRAACSTFAFEVEGSDVQTIEGIGGADGEADAVQRAFARASAFQCGFCTPGMIVLARALLAAHPQPDRATITEWISSNICRCTGYASIIEAVEMAARELAAEGAR